MRPLRLGLNLLASYIKNNRKSFLIGVAISLAAIFYLPKILPYLRQKPAATIGLAGNYTLATLPREIQDQLSVGLVKLQKDGTVAPAAALNWVATDSGRTLIFTLNPTRCWTDGAALDSAQINYNLKGVVITKPSSTTVRFSLKEPFAPLLPLLSQPLFKNGLVGLGENQVTEVKLNGRFLSAIRLTNQQTKNATIYKFYPTETDLLTALKLGAIRQAEGLHETAVTNLPKNFEVTGHIDGQTEAMIFFNLQKPFFDEKTFRQSLIYALPNDFAQGKTADSPIPVNSWVGNLLTKKYPQNLDLAKSSLEKVASGAALPKIILSTSRELKSSAEVVASSWKALGITVTVEVTDTRPINFDAYLIYVTLPPDPDQYALWHSTQTGNIAGYKSFKVDKLLEEGRQETDLEKRKTIYENFQKAITEDVPAAFLFYPKVYTIKR